MILNLTITYRHAYAYHSVDLKRLFRDVGWNRAVSSCRTLK